MADNAVLTRFRQFKAAFVSSNVSNNELLELIETFITSGADKLAVEEIPILDGQLSLSDTAA
jgi:hypothetical protein